MIKKCTKLYSTGVWLTSCLSRCSSDFRRPSQSLQPHKILDERLQFLHPINLCFATHSSKGSWSLHVDVDLYSTWAERNIASGWKPEKTYSTLEHLRVFSLLEARFKHIFFESFETLGSVTSNQHETVWRYKGPTHLEMSQTKQSLCHWPHLKRMCKTENGGNIFWKHVWQNQA